ncbi:MAG: type I-E CRISPR-associated protein Cas6/Cse3/CasE [bacterium]
MILNLRSRDVRRDLADCHEMHRTLMKTFPDLKGTQGKAREEFGLLYRVESLRKSGEIVIYVQSEKQPDWSSLPIGYLTETVKENPACKPIAEKYAQMKEGQVLSFALRANPTRKVGNSLKSERQAGKKNNGRRIFLTKSEDQIEWLKRKAVRGGFEILALQKEPTLPDMDVRPSDKITGRHRRITAEKEDAREDFLVFKGVLYQGRLRITNMEQFLTTLAGGIGSGKAYGFGLLSLAPPR